jgi:hypothetical protein
MRVSLAILDSDLSTNVPRLVFWGMSVFLLRRVAALAFCAVLLLVLKIALIDCSFQSKTDMVGRLYSSDQRWIIAHRQGWCPSLHHTELMQLPTSLQHEGDQVACHTTPISNSGTPPWDAYAEVIRCEKL